MAEKRKAGVEPGKHAKIRAEIGGAFPFLGAAKVDRLMEVLLAEVANLQCEPAPNEPAKKELPPTTVKDSPVYGGTAIPPASGPAPASKPKT